MERSANESYQGNVGSGLLKRFVVTFDYANHVLYLKKAPYQDADIAAFDGVGIWLNGADGSFRIMDVAVGGPADKAGLKAGDLVTAIDDTPALAMTLSEIRRTLKLVAVERPITVTAQRDNATVVATITPRDMIPR
jgi:C-terminal processing protease CtpA/Prc